MSVVIRLTPVGRKQHRKYRLRAAEASEKLTGKFIEELGSYDPTFRGRGLLKLERAAYLSYLRNGAKPSPTVTTVLNRAGLRIATRKGAPDYSSAIGGASPVPPNFETAPILLLTDTSYGAIFPDVGVDAGRGTKSAQRRTSGTHSALLLHARRPILEVPLTSLLGISHRSPWLVHLRVPQPDNGPRLNQHRTAPGIDEVLVAGFAAQEVVQFTVEPRTTDGPQQALAIYVDAREPGTRWARTSFRWAYRCPLDVAWRAALRFMNGVSDHAPLDAAFESIQGFVDERLPAGHASVRTLDEALLKLGALRRVHLFSGDIDTIIEPSGVRGALSVSVPVARSVDKPLLRAVVGFMGETASMAPPAAHALMDVVDRLAALIAPRVAPRPAAATSR